MKTDRITGTLHEDQCTFLISRSFRLRMSNVSDKSCKESQNTHSVLSIFFFFNLTVCEIKWENVVERGRPQMAIWWVCFACWIPEATNTHTQVV